MRAAPVVALVSPVGPVVPQRPTSLVAHVLADGVVLGLGQAAAQAGAPLQVRVQHIQRVSPQLAHPYVAENWLDGAPDVALVRFPGRHLEVGDFQVLGEGLAEGGFPVGEVVAIGLSEQLTERRGLPVTGSVPT